MKKTLNRIIIISSIAIFPFIALAATTNTQIDCFASNKGLGGVICQIQQLLNSIIPVLIALGVVYFVWGVVQYVINDSEEAKTKGRDKMIYGIIGFAVIICLWGLVNIVVNTFGLGGVAPNTSSLVPTPAANSSSLCTLPATGAKVQDLLNYVTCIIGSSVIPVIFAISIAMFIWGVVNFFIINADEEAKRAQGKQFMLWGIIALTVMLCVWGLVSILGNTFNINGSVLPKVQPPGSSFLLLHSNMV